MGAENIIPHNPTSMFYVLTTGDHTRIKIKIWHQSAALIHLTLLSASFSQFKPVLLTPAKVLTLTSTWRFSREDFILQEPNSRVSLWLWVQFTTVSLECTRASLGQWGFMWLLPALAAVRKPVYGCLSFRRLFESRTYCYILSTQHCGFLLLLRNMSSCLIHSKDNPLKYLRL